ncbi:MAG: DUF3108 domain-containing protein [Gammaproteobacteria bacterium]|nr:DUF3108 domain-containing protein [Gammaproteobacteria bacterium]MDH3372551.1 DUF3108 domain-containing protein [Gammaproteobacteria bacterium]MDH3408297.1 DUF3108 domain-containing protein [Gammaproteobacteria bacterium]MDH3552942.1 DUF3108 domain-containing protein [Gammaproteobacteria bacterium]
MANCEHQNATSGGRRLVVLLCAALLTSTAFAETALTPHTAVYEVKISVLSGQLNTELRSTATGYAATHVIKPTGMSRMLARGSISETSEFSSTAHGVRPKVYSSKDTISRDKADAYIRFDWETGEARGTVNGEEVLSVMDDLAHDRVSIQYELMYDMLHDGLSEHYTMFEIDQLRTVDVRNIGARTVKVPAGKFEVVGIQHQAEGSKRKTTFWCAPELEYLPVIIEQHRREKLKVRAELSGYTPAVDSQTVGLQSL